MVRRTRIERVEVRAVVKTYGAIVALRGVNADFHGGALSLVEGANGSGKSTLLGVVGTIVRPTSGRVAYCPIGEDRMRARAGIGWVSHDTLAYPDLSGRQNVELAAALLGEDPDAAWREAQERFELGAFALRPVRTCSRGQRQRVALARALVHRPWVVLLDEPTAGLDKAGVRRLVRVVGEEVARERVVVVVTHEPEIFEQASARIRLDRGRVTSAAD